MTDQDAELTEEALGNVAAQTRAVGERAAKLVGVELPTKAAEGAHQEGCGQEGHPEVTQGRTAARRLP